MKKHTLRTAIIGVVLVIALINIYPTVGWMLLSDEARAARRAQWEEEDSTYHEYSISREFAKDIKRWAQFDRSRVINLGLDLQGGLHMIVGLDAYTPDGKIKPEIRNRYSEKMNDDQVIEDLQSSVLTRIRRRINDFEAKEPIIQTLGKDQIQIQLPGEKDMDRAKRLIMKTAYLTFHIVASKDETAATYRKIDAHFNNNFIPFLQPGYGGVFQVKAEDLPKVRRIIEQAEEVPGLIPEGRYIAVSEPPKPWDDKQTYRLYLMDKEPGADGQGLVSAHAIPDDNNPGSYQIVFEFKGDGATRFAEVTGNNVNKAMAIAVDGKVISAPNIKQRIMGQGNITGNFTAEEARDLAIALSSGSMPVPIKEAYTGVVGPTLGTDSIRKGVLSSVIGVVVVVLFMLVYYRFAGLVANIALVINAVLVVAALAYFNSTLTLPGIAGLILTVGMAVDANVLIFERIREEILNGKSLLASIDSGYDKATVTILDANITTLIAAAVLWQFGTGPVEGFATTLSIGVCSSVFTALIVTRAVFDFMAERKMLSKLTMMTFVKEDAKFPFLKYRKYAFTLSALAIIIGMAIFVPRVNSGEMFGVDFSEGTSLTLKLHSSTQASVGDIREKLNAAGFNSAIVQEYEKMPNQFAIRLGESLAEGTEYEGDRTPIATKVQTILAELVPAGSDTGAGTPEDRVEILREETVGPAVGKQLRKDALHAIVYALMFIVVYLWFRFELKFAVGAVVALGHDVLVTVGLFAILGREISMPVVAALLTIIGYSLNDTIVVFDRIREDLRLYRGRGYGYLEIMDMSINQTLSRTLLTSITTLLVVVVLCIFGGSVIFDFALALLIGVVVGTYSSIFVASPVVYLWQKVATRHQEATAHPRQKNKKKAEANA